MHLAALSLSNFRNYSRLELPLSPGTTVITGDNAQGKSNLLEAILYLATTKSFRSATDRELINWLALDEPNAFARSEGTVERATRAVKLEILIREEPRSETDGELSRITAKRIRVNGLPKRAIDLIGQVNVVMFSPQDIEVVAGAPQARRRYLDLTISQVDPRYVRSLAHYNRVLQQRNHLLRQLRERPGDTSQLRFWDQELCDAGAYILLQRLTTITTLVELVRDLHRRLAGTPERMFLAYRASLGPEVAVSPAGESAEQAEEAVQAIATSFRQCLLRNQAREIAAGASLFGPHRDDFSFLVDDRDMGAFGSRAQQRTVALALKMAEVQFMRARTGEQPILLLDDILSELDRHRAACVLEVLDGHQQVLVTAVDARPFAASFLQRAKLLHVERGRMSAID